MSAGFYVFACRRCGLGVETLSPAHSASLFDPRCTACGGELEAVDCRGEACLAPTASPPLAPTGHSLGLPGCCGMNWTPADKWNDPQGWMRHLRRASRGGRP